MRALLRKLGRQDGVLAASTFLLVAAGLLGIYTVDIARFGAVGNSQKQLLAAVIGAVVLVGGGMVSATYYRASAHLFFAVGLLLLVLVFFFGVDVRGTRGWFRFASFSLQPVEFMKVGVVLLFARYVSRQKRHYHGLGFFAGSAVLVAVPAALTALQPDLGSSLLFVMFWFVMMILLRAPWRYIAAAVSLGALAAVAAWMFFLAPYQQERLITFVRPDHDPLGAGYNISQSLIAVGSGRWIGRGLGFGSQSQLRFLPEAQTDFIFAVLAESFGFVGSLLLLGLFGVLLYRLTRMAGASADDFAAVVIMGAFALFLVQFLVNMGAAIGILPITGVTMPLVSYGGSSLVALLLLLGIVQSMYAARGVS